MDSLNTQNSTFVSDIGEGSPLIFIHALGLNTAMWTLQVPGLASRYRVIRYDVRGHGLTAYMGEPITIWTLADDLLHLMDRLDLQRATIIGLSMGGVIAQAFAIRHPERVFALGLVSTVSVFGEAGRTGLRDRAITVEREGMEPMVAPAISRWFTQDFQARALASPLPQGTSGDLEAGPEVYEASVVDAISNMITAADPNGYAAVCRALADTDLTLDLHKITCPTLVMSGEQDPAVNRQSQETLTSHIKNTTEIVVPDCSHLIAIESASNFNSHVLDFLDRDRVRE